MATTTLISKEMRTCIQHCMECHQVCEETLSRCLLMGGKYAEPEHMRLMMDCAQICQTSADFMLRGSVRHTQTCAACADVCERCADSCQSLSDGIDLLKHCADVCRRCAETCRKESQLAAV
jgi:hypothetical protein